MTKITNKQIIEQIETLLIQLKQSLNLSHKNMPLSKKEHQSASKHGKIFSGLTGSINKLLEEGFFNESKTISELQKKLKDRGINKPTTSIMPSLKVLIKNEILDRSKPDKGLYKYFKRQNYEKK